MPTAGWLRRSDLPVDSGGRSYIDPPNLDQILDQFVNWRGDVNGGGHKITNLIVQPPSLEVGAGQTGDRNAFIDLVGDDFYSDYGLRILRRPGPNSGTTLVSRGTGAFDMETVDGAPIRFLTSNFERMRIQNNGWIGMGNNATAPQTVLHVVGGSGTPAATYGSAVIAGGGPQFQVRIGYESTNNYGWIQAVQDGISARSLVLNGAGGNIGINTLSPGMIAGAVTSATVTQMKTALAIGGGGQASNEDALIQLASFNFLSANNWSGWGLWATNLVVQSVGGVDTFYTPLTHPSLGYKGIRMVGTVIEFIGGSGATNGGSGVTPTVYMKINNSGLVGIGSAGDPNHNLCVTGPAWKYTDANSGGAIFSVGNGPASTDDQLMFGFDTTGFTLGSPYAWIQGMKAGTATRALVLNPNNGPYAGVIIGCPDGTYLGLPRNSLTFFFAAGKLYIRTSDSAGATRDIIL